MKIVSFYDDPQYVAENRMYSPATASVIDYIADTLVRIGKSVEIISPSETKNKSGSFAFRTNEIREGVVLTACATRGYKNKLLRAYSKLKSRLWLVKYLLSKTERREIVIFWKTPPLYEPIILYKILDRKHTRILYYASEIYQEVIPTGMIRRKEEWLLFEKADLFIMSTELLNDRINSKGKPSIILHGSYKLEKKCNKRFSDNLIHVVYAGIINNNKGSGKAVEIAKYLSDSYHVNIIGYGTEDDLAYLKNSIEVSNQSNACKVSYDGLLLGEAFCEFLQMCDIGICSQNLDAKYNNCSFPSKILVYLSNNLRVVSINIKTIKSSVIGDCIYYSDSDSAEDFANAIKQIQMNHIYDSRKLITKLDNNFVGDLSSMLDENM